MGGRYQRGQPFAPRMSPAHWPGSLLNDSPCALSGTERPWPTNRHLALQSTQHRRLGATSQLSQ
jgi:hypothetical protein